MNENGDRMTLPLRRTILALGMRSLAATLALVAAALYMGQDVPVLGHAPGLALPIGLGAVALFILASIAAVRDARPATGDESE